MDINVVVNKAKDNTINKTDEKAKKGDLMLLHQVL